jgi:hypothetical protein
MKKFRLAAVLGGLAVFGILPLAASSSEPFPAGCYSHTACFGGYNGGIGQEDEWAEYTSPAFSYYLERAMEVGCGAGYGGDQCPIVDPRKACMDACYAQYVSDSLICTAIGGGPAALACWQWAANKMANCIAACG